MTAGRQTRGFLFADLRDYSRFTEQHGDDAARELLHTYRVLVRGVIARHQGAEIRTEGDSPDGIPAQEAWSFGDASGDLVCYETTTGDAVVLWSRDDSELLGRAVRDDRDMAALLAWWEGVARFRD